MSYPPEPPAVSIGPAVTVYIEFVPEEEHGQYLEVRMPFVPRVGETLHWGPLDQRVSAEVKAVSWIFDEPDFEGQVRLSDVRLYAEPLEEEDD